MAYEYIRGTRGGQIKAWIRGVTVEKEARKQLDNIAAMPFIQSHVAIMPDCHWGMGATVGSVIPTRGAIIPAAVGADIGCGMMAVKTGLTADRLPDTLAPVRSAIEAAIPHGRTDNGGKNDRGAWSELPRHAKDRWTALADRYKAITERHPKALSPNNARHMGTLGTGNHFIEMCLDENDSVWAMLHSGSRGCGNRLGTYFIEKAKREMERWFIHLPDKDLAYLVEGSELFDDYVAAVRWAQDYALENRRAIMAATLTAMRSVLPPFETTDMAVNCHHNYVALENHFGKNVYVTRKGTVRARADDLGIIPGSMGARSYIVRGKGNAESFHSCSHGAGRAMSRNEAKRRFSTADHERATAGIECRKDADVIDETPMAYKDIDAVIAAQDDLIDVVHTLRQVVCVKG